MRLDKFFTSQSLATRKEAKELVKKGRVSVNGETVKFSDIQIDPERDIILLDGQNVSYKEYIYIMLNKPQGVVSATEDTAHRTVLDLVPPELYRKGLFPAGRLDKDTEGFVLLTDDGDFAHRMLAPKKHVPKTYHAVIDQPIDETDIAAFREGLRLSDGTVCMRAELKVLQAESNPLVEVILQEGKYHQVKRMFESRGKRVVYLKRVKIGGLPLDETLGLGECREILHKELEKILDTQKGQNF